MKISIQSSGNTVSKNSSIINDLNVGRGNVDISVQDSSFTQDSQVLNNVNIEKGNVGVQVKDSEFKSGSRVIRNHSVKKGDLQVDLENTYLEAENEFDKKSDIPNEQKNNSKIKKDVPIIRAEYSEEYSKSETAIVAPARKKSLLQRIIEFFTGTKRNISETQDISQEIGSSKKEHKKFVDELSRDGQLKNITRTLEEDKDRGREDTQQSREEDER